MCYNQDMAELFKMDAEGLIRLRKLYKRAPKLFIRAAAFTLNGFALGVQRNSKDIIGERFTLRNPKFILGALRVTLAKASTPINKMQSVFGSLKRPRYSGIEEQETGKAGPRNRVFTSAARDGTFSKQTKGYARLKPNAKYPSPTNARLIVGKKSGQRDFSLAGLSGAKRIAAFLSLLNESKKAQTFIIKKKFGRFKRGLYRFQEGKVQKLQAFDAKRKPRRIRWLTEGRRRYFDQTDVQRVWSNSLNKVLKKRR